MYRVMHNHRITIQLPVDTVPSNAAQTPKNKKDTETDEQKSVTKDDNIESDKQQLLNSENQDRAFDPSNYRENENEMDEHEMHAADGLLMLQELSQFDNPDTEEDENSQLMPIGPIVSSQISDPTETTTKETTKDDTSEDTVIYDPPDSDPTPNAKAEAAQPLPPPEKDEQSEVTPQSATELTVKQKPEKDEQAETQEKDKKGTLVIREVGLRKGGTQTDTVDDTPMPTITSSGKVRCNFCRRDFNTLAEQKQHMTRRHPDQLREQEAKRKREKDERIEREQFKQAIESLKKQEQDKKKKPKKSSNTTNTTKPTKPKGRNRIPKTRSEEGEPTRKKQKIRDKSTSTRRRYSCPSDNCNKSYDTQAELNKHHKDSHPPVECPVCNKEFPTPNTLDRHMYKHRGTLECQYCDETFAFQSELDLHLIVHEDEPTFFCKSCTKSFMRIGDLREHEESHSGNIHYCTIKGCDFSAPLKRYVKTHIKTTHAKKDALPYPCPKCAQRFKFYEQRKRHLASDHQ